MSDVCLQDAITVAGMLRRGEVSAREVVSAHIARIEAFDPAINAIVTRTFDAALDRAAAADDAMASGRVLGLLHGLPVAHKDLADTAGVRTTYGSPLFATNVPQHDALVVQRMGQAGAISLGKTNVPEFGAGLAYRQRSLRRDSQPVRPRAQCGRQQRRCRCSAGRPADRFGRWQ